MPAEYLPIATIIIIATGFSFLVVLIGHLFGPREPSERKQAPYESGMQPYGTAQRRMRVQYYLIAVLFILFDIEIVFLLPWAVILRDLGISGLVEMGIFLAVLIAGLVYAWAKGALEWE